MSLGGPSLRQFALAFVRGLAIVLLVAGSSPAAAQASTPATTPGRPFTFGGDDAQPPYQYLDAAKQPQGFNVDLIRAISRVSGRPVVVQLRKGDVLDQIADGSIDLAALSYTDERTKIYGFLDEVWTVRLAVFFPPGRNSPPDAVSKLGKEIIALRIPSLTRDTLAALPESQRPAMVAAQDHKEAVAMLHAGQVTAAAGNDIGLREEFARLGLTDVPELLLKANAYRLVTKKGREAEFAWISGALKRLRDSGEYSRIVEKHLAASRPETSFREFAQSTGMVIAALTLVAVLALGWNRSLRLQVAARTARLAEAATERERSLVEIQKANQKLEAKNAELERFTYTVSHDLRSPLITIRGYLGHLETSAAEGNLERFREDAARIKGATTRMDALLRDLLELSRVGRVLNPASNVSMAAVARDASDLLRGPLRDCGARLEIAPDLPAVRGDRQRLLEVVQNLVENGIKFMGDQSEPTIRIGVRPDPNHPIFFVSDNGIGIDPKHHQKVFDLFEKLDPRAEGTGVGLALVKRIVEAHGGRVWIESPAGGRGTTFCFTLGGEQAS
jgi:signal transduction histidine kinase